MYTLNGQILKEGQGFQDSTGKYYPANWLTYSTDAEKAAIGIIYIPDQPKASQTYYDQRFYWGPNNPKDLDGLKLLWVDKTNTTANTKLSPTDWMIIRAVDPSAGISVSMEVQEERALIRQRANEKEALIQECESVAELEVYVTSSSYYNWSEEDIAAPEFTPTPTPEPTPEPDSGNSGDLFTSAGLITGGFNFGAATTIFGGSGEDTLTFS